MYIKDREKIEKLLTNLVNEMIDQELIEADKKEVKSNFKNARVWNKTTIGKDRRRLHSLYKQTILKELVND